MRNVMIRSVILLLAGVSIALAGDPTPPPVVIRSEPVSGAEAVDPALTELRVTFSRDMVTENYAWPSTQFGPSPETTGKPCFLPDGRTCVLPVKLKPSTAYAIGINWGRFNSFMDKESNRALPWLLTFRTADRSPAERKEAKPASAEALALLCADDLQAGRHEAVMARFDPTMSGQVDAPLLAAAWALTEQQCGTPIERGTPISELQGAVRVVTVPLRGPKGTFHLVCSSDAGNRIVGLWLRPGATGRR
jgi:RNA polymerase sigma-70 factor (ECF subfamily)